MRSRAVSLPLAWTFSTAASPTGCSVSSVHLDRSASLPAVVWMSTVCSAAGSALWSETLVMVVDAIEAGGMTVYRAPSRMVAGEQFADGFEPQCTLACRLVFADR